MRVNNPGLNPAGIFSLLINTSIESIASLITSSELFGRYGCQAATLGLAAAYTLPQTSFNSDNKPFRSSISLFQYLYDLRIKTISVKNLQSNIADLRNRRVTRRLYKLVRCLIWESNICRWITAAKWRQIKPFKPLRISRENGCRINAMKKLFIYSHLEFWKSACRRFDSAPSHQNSSFPKGGFQKPLK